MMERTSLTVGGFTQPAVARSLIELPSNIEKGLSTRFLWIFPKPCYAKFESLEPVNKEFSSALGKSAQPCMEKAIYVIWCKYHVVELFCKL